MDLIQNKYKNEIIDTKLNPENYDLTVFNEILGEEINNIFNQKLLYSNSHEDNFGGSEDEKILLTFGSKNLMEIINEDIDIYNLFKKGEDYKTKLNEKHEREKAEREKMKQEIVRDDEENKDEQINPDDEEGIEEVGVEKNEGNEEKGEENNENKIDNIKKISEDIKKYRPNAKLYIESIYPVNKSLNKEMVNQRTNEAIKSMNKKIEEYCKKEKISYINIYDELTDEDGNFDKKYTNDGLHPNDLGYAKITKLLLPYIYE